MATAEEHDALLAERDALRDQNAALRTALVELGRLLEGLAEGTTSALGEVQRIFDRLPE